MSVGSVWSFKASGRVSLTRPDGSAVLVDAVDGRVHYVLSAPGTYSVEVGGKTLTVKAA